MPRRKSTYRVALGEFAEYLRGPERPVNIPDSMPATLEVGMGAGHRLLARAADEPHRFFLGIEIKEERTFQAAREVRRLGLQNVAFVVGEVSRVAALIPPDRFDELVILFPDPWPKTRDARRRLVHARYLELYARWVAPGARCLLRSDNPGILATALAALPQTGFAVVSLATAIPAEPVQTRFEARFRNGDIAISEVVFTPLPR
jgi:tRNA (guanine-N7-)-methyltransferase